MNRSEMSRRAWRARREREALFDELNSLLKMFDLPHLVGYGDARPVDHAEYRFRLYEGKIPFAVHYARDAEGLREIVNRFITERTCG